MARRIQFRRGTAAQWSSANPVLMQGEPAAETDTGKTKVGDGVTAWSSLPYTATTGSQGPTGPGVPLGGAAGALLAKTSATDLATGWSLIRASGAGELDIPVVATHPASPSTGRSLIYAGPAVGGGMPHFRGANDGVARLQRAFLSSSIRVALLTGNATTITTLGTAAPTATGTATARNVATTNMLSRALRLGYVSAPTAGSLAGPRLAVAQFTTGAVGLGGFYFTTRFAISDASLVATARTFVGVRNSAVAPTNVEPSTITQCIGVGHGAADTTLSIYYGGTVAQTPISLGADFPANTTNTDWYELTLFSPSDTVAPEVRYEVVRLNTGHHATGTLTGAGTVLPSDLTLLTPNYFRTNNATAAAVGLDWGGWIIETSN